MNINWQLRELDIKIVYYGPALSGKTTNLELIHARVARQHRSELISLKTHEDRTLYFDFLQLELGKIGGLLPKIHLYTVPGQPFYEASRKLVLRGADGVVFVADSSPERLRADEASWQNLQDHLGAFGLSLQLIPVVIQCNKQDLAGAMPPELIRCGLLSNGLTLVPAVANQGIGVLDTLKLITTSVISHIQKQMS